MYKPNFWTGQVGGLSPFLPTPHALPLYMDNDLTKYENLDSDL